MSLWGGIPHPDLPGRLATDRGVCPVPEACREAPSVCPALGGRLERPGPAVQEQESVVPMNRTPAALRQFLMRADVRRRRLWPGLCWPPRLAAEWVLLGVLRPRWQSGPFLVDRGLREAPPWRA